MLPDEIARLPISAVLRELTDAIASDGQAVLQAPPGAGKTTGVPLAVLETGIEGRIIMLEPRRIAARAAADRMASLLGEKTGQTVGYRVRGDSRISKATRIEVVTEAILTRRIQNDPDLHGVAAVIFDEFHERSLHADLGLALTLEVRDALRPDLILLVMSATLDAEPVAALMGGAPVITSQGRSFPVETRYLQRPLKKTSRFENDVADLTIAALGAETGSALVFLPGEGEIRRVQQALTGRIGPETMIRPLFGAMKLSDQRAAIRPVAEGRKVVLATSVAETSLTIEGIAIVVDGGLARRVRFDPNSGMSRLVTERVTRAEAEQRRGRAGRLTKGVCYRLWTKGEEGALAAYAPAEIEVADLSGLALELAQWGAAPTGLGFLTAPPEGTFAEACKLLQMLGALDQTNRITDHGRTIAALPVHPRLAHMLAVAGKSAADLAALLSDRDIDRSAGVDLSTRIDIIRGRRRAPNSSALDRLRIEAKRLADLAPDKPSMSHSAMVALAYPDRIGLRRPGDAPRWLLSGGKGARMDEGAVLSGARMLVATDLDGETREARIRQALRIDEETVRELFADKVFWRKTCRWSRRQRAVEAREQEVFGALVLKRRIWRDAPPEAIAAAALEGVRDLGLNALKMTGGAQRFLTRVDLARRTDEAYPTVSEAALLGSAESWLLPYLGQVRTASDLAEIDFLELLKSWVGWALVQRLDALVPPRFTTPLGRQIVIDYSADVPAVSARLQEFFGVSEHPRVAGQALKITLLSPAGRPIAVTSDLPGFWSGSYADVRKDMRGRYPKHPWPEDPTAANPTLRAKPRR